MKIDKKNINEYTFKSCFSNILNADKENSRLAARKVRKILYSSRDSRDRFSEIKDIINGAYNEYNKISDEWRQENFVSAISVIYFLHGRDSEPDFLFPWLLHLLQHKNGVIRYAAVRMMGHELGPLTVHIRCPDNNFRELAPEVAEVILFSLFIGLNDLLNLLWEPKYKRYKYVSSLPACPFKSVQMVLAEMQDCCGQKCMDNFGRLLSPLTFG